MGLLYAFPVSREEKDFVFEEEGKLTLKTYGLPYIFWIYALCCIAVVFFMFLAIRPPILKLILLGDSTDALLGYSLLTFIGSLPVAILAFFFYEKRIIRDSSGLNLQHRLFALPVFTEKFPHGEIEQLSIAPFLSSPNMARMKNSNESAGFQNKGYFVLWLHLKAGKKISLDRHSRKVDLEKLKNLLEHQN
jgi:hypothetical protein